MKQRRFRSKPLATPADGVPEEEEEEDGPGIVIGQSSSAAVVQREKERRVQKASRAAAIPVQQRAGGAAPALSARKPLLSFEGHEEAPLSQKSKEPNKLKPGRSFVAAVPKRDNAQQSTQISAPGEYSAERLNALHSSTRVLPSRPQPKEPAFKLSGSFKAATAPADDRFTVNAKDMIKKVQFESHGSRSQEALLPPPSRGRVQAPAAPPPAAPAGGQPSAVDTRAPGPGDSSEEEGFTVPDAAAIRRAKAKREMLRSAHLAPDYVPLGGAAGLTASSKQEAAARLRSQSDDAVANSEDDADEEDAIRMQFVGGTRPVKSRAAPQAGEAQDNEPEDDDEAWVRQQISKGAGRQAGVAAAASHVPAVGRSASDVFSSGAASGAAVSLQDAAGAGPQRVAEAGAAVLASLHTGTVQLQASHTFVKKQLERGSGQIADSISSVAGLEAHMSGAKTKYTYMQEKRCYIADLCDMLQMKAPIVEVLEERAMEAAEERAAAVAAFAAEDDAEELRVPEAAVAAALGVLSRGGAAPAAQSAAASSAREAESYGGEALPQQLDEFGRDMNVEKRREALERAERRRGRHAAEAARVAAARAAEQLEDAWGDDTTDEDEPEVARYRRERAQILEAASTVFADAGEDFANIGAVKRRLEDWRAHYPSTWRDAYMGVSEPAIFAPFVRSQLINWDPLFAPGAGFDNQEWYTQLFDYGLQLDANGAGPKPSEDEELVPALVQRIVARRALHAIEHAWNPLSAKQSVAVAALLKNLEVYLAPEDSILQEMVAAVGLKLSSTAQRVLVPAWPRAAVAVSPVAMQTLGRRFGRAVRLLRSIAAFEGAVPSAPLRALALDTIFARQLLALIRGTPTNPGLSLERMTRCTLAMPSSWLAQNQDKRASPLLEQLQAISRVLQSSRHITGNRSVLDSHLNKLMKHARLIA